MKINVELVQKKGMSERQVRDHIEKATATARTVEAQKGNGDLSHEKVREQMIKNAERDKREGKI